jgi:penicillin G amidase
MPFIDKLGSFVLKPIIQNMSKARLPQLDGNVKITGLKEPVEIIRDRWGVAHIYAHSLPDLLIAQGFTHAQDRLFQMEMFRRVARGQLAELIGKDGIEVDKYARTMGYERIAKKDWEVFESQPELRDLINYYCQGVNAFIKQAGEKKLPVEFGLLKISARPWEPVDVLSFSRLMVALLTWGWYDEIIRAKLISYVGEAAAAELDNSYPKGNPITLPKGIEFNKLDLGDIVHPERGEFIPNIQGSNAWSVSGKRSITGKPFLCNDPHLSLKNPNIWYENHIYCPELHATGASIPGLPMCQIGHNEKIGWGITLSFTDLEDIFMEDFTDSSCRQYVHGDGVKNTIFHEEKIFIKGHEEPYTFQVLETIHGPVISDIINEDNYRLSLCSQALKPGKVLEGWYRINKASNWDEFTDGVSYITAPGLNICYADVDGNIGYYNSGQNPVKNKTTASVPSTGNGAGDWEAFVPFNEMPHAFNPEQGYVATCNHKIEPEGYPHFLGDIYMNGYRANRLKELFSQKEKFGPDDFTAMQTDFHCVPGKEFAALYRDIHFEAAEYQQLADLMLEWDGVLAADKIEGSIYKVTKNFVVRRLYEAGISDKQLINALMGKGTHDIYDPVSSFLGHNTATLLRVINDPDSWWVAQAGGKEKVLKEGLRDAVNWLRVNYGTKKEKWLWGRVHAITFKHTLSIKPTLARIFDVGPFPMGGDTDTLWQTCELNWEKFDGELAGPSYRQIIDFSNFDKSTTVTPAGASGNMASPFYFDQLEDWFKGNSHPMSWSRKQVEAHQKHKLMLRPQAI